MCTFRNRFASRSARSRSLQTPVETFLSSMDKPRRSRRRRRRCRCPADCPQYVCVCALVAVVVLATLSGAVSAALSININISNCARDVRHRSSSSSSRGPQKETRRSTRIFCRVPRVVRPPLRTAINAATLDECVCVCV